MSVNVTPIMTAMDLSLNSATGHERRAQRTQTVRTPLEVGNVRVKQDTRMPITILQMHTHLVAAQVCETVKDTSK